MIKIPSVEKLKQGKATIECEGEILNDVIISNINVDKRTFTWSCPFGKYDNWRLEDFDSVRQKIDNIPRKEKPSPVNKGYKKNIVKNVQYCSICGIYINDGDIYYSSGENFFHFECYEYLKNDKKLKKDQGIEDKIKQIKSDFKKDHSYFVRLKNFLKISRSIKQERHHLKIEIIHLENLKKVLSKIVKYKAFRRKKLNILYDYWESYDFDNYRGLPPDWEIRRAEILKRDKYRCTKCKFNWKKENSTLHVHHIKERGNIEKGQYGYDHTHDNLVTLCERHHREIHGGYFGSYHPADKGFIIPQKYKLIRQVIENNEISNNQLLIWIYYRQRHGYYSKRAVKPFRMWRGVIPPGKNEFWYIQGHCYFRNDDKRRFRVNRIIDIQIINEHEIPDDGGELL